MSRRTLLLALLLALVAAAAAWRAGLLDPTPPARKTVRTPPRPQFQARWATEQAWLVDLVTRDVRELGALAGRKPLPPADAPAVQPEALRFEEHLFAPAAYQAIALESLGAVGAAPPPTAEDERKDAALLEALLAPRVELLLAQDAALQAQLDATPADPGAHERAALLLAAFALRDCSGRSTDPRPTLTRMAAHLALARALRRGGEAGPAGRYADAALTTLVRRERDALGRLDALAAAAKTGAEQAWLRALRLRTTADWRLALADRRLTLLEQREQFRALARARDDDYAVAWLEARKPEPLPDWPRIALDSRRRGVGTTSRFAELNLALTMAEAQQVLAALGAAPAEVQDFFDAVNRPLGGSVERSADGAARSVVIGRTLWAYQLQRDIVFALSMNTTRLWNLGLPGERRAFRDETRERFGRLALFPLVLRHQEDDAATYRTAMAAVRELAVRSPELVTAAHWEKIREKPGYAPVATDLPDQHAWFRPALPVGTLLDVGNRLAVTALAMASPAELAALHGQAPYDADLAELAASRVAPAKATASELEAFYGPLAQYNLTVMGIVSHAAWYDPPRYRETQGRLCELDASFCFPLGHRLAELGFAEEAAAAYQKAFDGSSDRVLAANRSRWLVEYYADRGQIAKAEAVAKEAAGTYAGGGLFSMALLMERTGRFREAEEYYRRILERYDRASGLAGFYYRMARERKLAEYEARLKDTLALALPAGLEPFDGSKLPPAPVDGVVFRGGNDFTLKYGIQWGNVIVACDGYRVRDWNAYQVVKELSHSPRMKLVIWRGGRYDEIEVELWDRMFNVDMDTFKAAPATAVAGPS